MVKLLQMDTVPLFKMFLPKSRLNRSLRILTTTNAILIFIMGLFLPFYAVFVQKIGGSIAFAGFSWGLFQIVSGVLIFVMSSWEVRVKQKELLVALGYFLRGLVFLSYAFMGSVTQLIFTQIAWGVAAAISMPAFDSAYAEHTSKSGSIAQWGNWEGIAAVSAGVAALLGGVFIESLGFTPVFISMAIISVSLSVYLWFLPRNVI